MGWQPAKKSGAEKINCGTPLKVLLDERNKKMKDQQTYRRERERETKTQQRKEGERGEKREREK